MEKKKKRWYNFLYIVFVQGGDRMGESRQNPEQLLKSLQTDEENRNKGHLKIFFGYAAGVGAPGIASVHHRGSGSFH